MKGKNEWSAEQDAQTLRTIILEISRPPEHLHSKSSAYHIPTVLHFKFEV